MTKREELRELKRTAHHEAGHAVIAYVYGFRPYRATIVRKVGESYGEVRIKTTTFTMLYPPELAKWMVYGLAGIAAQDRYSRSSYAFLAGGADDLEDFANDWCKLHVLTEGKCGSDYDFEKLARRAVNQYWYAISHFASVLLERKTLEGDELDQTLSEAIFYPEEYKRPPAINEVCPFDPCAPFELPELCDLEAQGAALRREIQTGRRAEISR